MAAKKTKKQSSPSKPLNKSAFIRDNSALSPQEIVAKAKSKGIDLSIAMVYTIRSQSKASKKTKPALKTKATVATTHKPSGSPEAQFGQLILTLGTERARALFDATMTKVMKSLG